MKKKAVILVSGGMDSAVAAALACQKHEPCFFHADYGQRTEKKERAAFHRLARFYGVREKLLCRLEHLGFMGASALTDRSIGVPQGLSRRGVPVTYVPFRNANLLSAAVSWAEVIGAEKIYIGATEEDSAGYPDCRFVFYTAFNQMIRTGTKKGNIRIITPLIRMKKTGIVRLGQKLGVPFEHTWSCYLLEKKACGKCDSCLRRLAAFRKAGAADPIPYQ